MGQIRKRVQLQEEKTIAMLKKIWKRLKSSPPTARTEEFNFEKRSSSQDLAPSVPSRFPETHDDDESSSESESSLTGIDDELYEDVTSFAHNAEAQASERPTFDLTELARTAFPEFDLDGVPDGELTEASDDESMIREKEERYSTKEDEDVMVFMKLAKKMTVTSLLHLLQGHVHAQNHSNVYLSQYDKALASGETKASSIMNSPRAKKPLLKIKKQFRWAEITGDKVRTVVHEVQSLRRYKNLWWQPAEMQAIRVELVESVRFFRKHRLNYIKAVEVIARNNQDEAIIDEKIKLLTEDSYARGLESQIVKMLSDHRKFTVTAVLEEQKECRLCGDDPETTMHCLREQSLAYSQLSTKFSYRMGKCDQVEALKCNMSRWNTGV